MAHEDKDVKSLDAAIIECSNYINEQRKNLVRLLIILMQLGIIAVLGGFYLFVFRGNFEQVPQQTTLMTTVVTGILVLISILIGVLVSLYRFHLLEIARTEHYKIGFLRVRVAANNTSPGFSTEVRVALTDGAFQYESSRPAKGGRIDSPLPGHPTSDLSTAVLNKFLDSVEVALKPKSSTAPKEG